MKAAFFNVKKQSSHPRQRQRRKRSNQSAQHQGTRPQDVDTNEKGAAFATKAAPRSLFLCTGRGTFLFLFQEEKKCGAQSFLSLPRRKNTPLWDATVPPSSNKAKNTPLRGAAVPPLPGVKKPPAAADR